MANNAGRFYKLYVSHLPWTISHTELRQYFSKFGPVNLATVIFDKNTGLSKHFGFVSFGNQQSFEEVSKINEHILDGQIIRVTQSNQEINHPNTE